jgi:replicative DNA helicase
MEETTNFSKVSKILDQEDKFLNYDRFDKVVSSDEMSEKIAKEPENPVSFKSGIPTLDSYIERFEGGEMIIVSGKTKNGKTTFAQTLTKNFHDKGIFSLWFSYEMPTRQLLRKFPKQTLFFLPQVLADKNLDWIENRIYEAKLKFGVQAVFIDHLHFVVDLAANNPSWEVGRVVRYVKKLAVKHNVVIFLLAHLKKVKLENRMPDIDDLRDSSFIAQDSDGVFFMTRSFYEDTDGVKIYGDMSKLTVAVHRESGTMEKSIDLIYKDNKFYEYIDGKNEGTIKEKTHTSLFGEKV